MEGVRLNLPEINWLVSCSIVTDRYLFLCLFKYGYQIFLCARYPSWFTVVEPGETANMKVLKKLVNASFILVFANTVLHKRAMVLIFYADFTRRVLSILSRVYYVAHHGWVRIKFFKMKGLRRLER